MDEDICPLRGPHEVRELISETAELRGIPLLNYYRKTNGRSKHGIADSAQFLDHVHLGMRGYRRLALDLMQVMEQLKIVKLEPNLKQSRIEWVSKQIEDRVDARAHGVALRSQAKVFSRAGKVNEAERLAAQAAEVLNDDAEAQFVLGRSAERRGASAQAILHYQKTIDLMSNHYLARNNLGNLLLAQGEYEQAIVHFQAALKPKPEFAPAMNNMGNALRAQGKSGDAIVHYKKAMAANPSNPQILFNLGHTLHNQGNVLEAIDYYQRALALQPDHAQSHYNLGNLFASKKQFSTSD